MIYIYAHDIYMIYTHTQTMKYYLAIKRYIFLNNILFSLAGFDNILFGLAGFELYINE